MRNVINFNRKWAFTKMADSVPEVVPTRWDIVNLPHSWNAIDGQDGNNDFYRGTCMGEMDGKKAMGFEINESMMAMMGRVKA